MVKNFNIARVSFHIARVSKLFGSRKEIFVFMKSACTEYLKICDIFDKKAKRDDTEYESKPESRGNV